MYSPDLTQASIDTLAELFPNCFAQARDAKGVLKRSIDFGQLRQALSTSIVEGPQERYQLNWPGKREALLTANAPIAKTLRPCRQESVALDPTQNLFIEGDTDLEPPAVTASEARQSMHSGVMDCFTAFAMTGIVRNGGNWLPWRELFAMTGIGCHGARGMFATSCSLKPVNDVFKVEK